MAAFVGLSEGVVVGSALVAFITLLDIVPRLAQLSNTENSIKKYERVIVFSATIVSLWSFSDINIYTGKIMLVIIGFLMGVFIGLLAAALAEVTNVIPVLVNKCQLNDFIRYIFFSLASGKVAGSLIYWLFINK